MLKVYDVRSMFQINHQKWDVCGSPGWVCKDESEVCEEVVILDKMRFYRTLEAIASNPNGYDGMVTAIHGLSYNLIFLSPGKFDGLVSKAENLSVIITEAKTKFKEEHKMIVDRILDRKDGEPYDAKDFYNYCMEEQRIFGYYIGGEITRAVY